MASHQTVFFELAQLLGEHFFGDRFQLLPDFREAPRPEGEMPENLHFPFAGNQINRCLDGTSVMVLHRCVPSTLITAALTVQPTYKKVRTYAAPLAVIP
jgi:hypothetical protein